MSLLNRTSTPVADNKVVTDIEVIRLDGFESVDRGRLGLADHLNLRLGTHPSPLGGLQGGVLSSVGPDGGAGEDEVDLGGGHERLAVPAGQGVHGVAVDLGEVVADGVDDGLVEALELGGGLQGAYVEGELLGPVEEELDAAQPRLLGPELEPPLHRGLGAGRRVRAQVVRDLGGDLVRRDAVSAGPRLDDLDVIRG